MKSSHLSEFAIQRLVDLPAEQREAEEAFRHVQECTLCKARLQRLERIHIALQKQQFEPADEIQIERIINRIRSRSTESMLVPVLQRFAYVFALLLVLGIIGVVFYQFDVIDYTAFQLPADDSIRIFGGWFNAVQEQFTMYSSFLINVYDRLFGVETFPIFSFTVIVLVFLAVLDRWLLLPMLRRSS